MAAIEILVIITIKEQLETLESEIQSADYIAFDTETTGTDKDSQIIGFSVAWELNKAYYVPILYWNTISAQLEQMFSKEDIYPILNLLKTKNLIMHNAVFDCSMVENNYNIKLIDSVHTDTLLLGHLLNENRRNGLKELGTFFFGSSAKKEQEEMKASILKNGGKTTKDQYDLYKADYELIARYGAKDAILTIKLFYILLEDLEKEGLYDFFYKDETMPLLRTATYDLNTKGIRVDPEALKKLKMTLETECLEMKAFIYKEIEPYVKDKYAGTNKKNVFNIGSNEQIAWLLFEKLDNYFDLLTDAGKELCFSLGMKVPYSNAAKRDFINTVKLYNGSVYKEAQFNSKTGKMEREKKVASPWKYMKADRASLGKLADRYKWVKTLLAYNKNKKLISTYIEGIEAGVKYNIIHPSFLQFGTTSGRYSSRNPNFQNLPRDDKRIKACLVSRPGKMFVGADYSQLEPRVFASFSKDSRLLECFKSGQDFYSVIGASVFGKHDVGLVKDDSANSFAVKYKKLRDIAKVVALSATYGTTASKMAIATGKSKEEAQEIIDDYFTTFPSVYKLMLESHEIAKSTGQVSNLFGRVRRIPKAKEIKQLFGNIPHEELEYEFRNLLNLAVNHRIQSTGASIINRAAIAFCRAISDNNIKDCHIVMQIHDELIVECLQQDAQHIKDLLKYHMENTVVLPGVALVAEPKIANNIAGLK